MKKRVFLLYIFFLFTLGISISAYASKNIKNSIFQVISIHGSSTAFLTEDGLVTTLHSVLPGFSIQNFSQIQVNIGKQNCVERVRLIGVIPKMDLALLSTPKRCKAQALKTSRYYPSDRKLMLYGHPLSISEILDSEVRVRNIGLKPVSIYLNKTERRGPYRGTKVISLDEHMLPGHSGAPLFLDNQVVGIANGGKVGTPVSWAIPWANNIQWLKENQSIKNEINRLINFQKDKELYQSTLSKDKEIITIEFTNGRLMSVPIQDNIKIDLGEQRGQPSLIKKGYSNQVIGYDLAIKEKDNNKRFAKGIDREFYFIRSGNKLILEIKPPGGGVDANYIYDNVNKLMWTKRVFSKTWSQIDNYVQTVNRNPASKYNDWRLPSKGELIALNSMAKNNPQLVNNTSDWYWSSDEGAFLGRFIIVNGGTVPNTNKLMKNRDIDQRAAVRLVRNFR